MVSTIHLWLLPFFSVYKLAVFASAIASSPSLDKSLALHPIQDWLHTTAGRDKARHCLPMEAIPTEGKNFTPEDLRLLHTICWRDDLTVSSSPTTAQDRGIPAGIKCQETTWRAPYPLAACNRDRLLYTPESLSHTVLVVLLSHSTSPEHRST